MANIFAQFAQPVRSVMDYQNDADNQALKREQLGAAQRTNALADLSAQQTRQTMADTQQSNALIKAAYSQPDVIKALRATGNRAAIELADKQETQALGRGKTEAETSKLQAEAQAKAAEAKHAAATHLAQRIAMIQTPEDLAAYEAEGIALGVFPQQAQGQAMAKAQQLGGIEQWKQLASQSAVPIVERFKADADMARARLQSDTSIKTTGMSNETSVRTTGMTNATTRRGQDMTAGTAAAGRAQADRHFGVTQDAAAKDMIYDADRGVLINKATGLARPAATMDGTPLGAKDKPLTDGQAKAALFGARMEASNKVLSGLAASGTEASVPGSRAGFGVGSVITAASPAKQQQLDQAKRDFINATLRRESGAVISDSEFSNAEKQYFPQIGDSKEVKDQKANNRAIAIRGVQAEVPNASGVVKKIIGDAGGGKTVKRTGTSNGRKVIEYSDGSIAYAD